MSTAYRTPQQKRRDSGVNLSSSPAKWSRGSPVSSRSPFSSRSPSPGESPAMSKTVWRSKSNNPQADQPQPSSRGVQQLTVGSVWYLPDKDLVPKESVVHKSNLTTKTYGHPVLILDKRTEGGEEWATFVICWSHGGRGIGHLKREAKRNHLLVGETEDTVMAHEGSLTLPLAPGSERFVNNTYVQIHPAPPQLQWDLRGAPRQLQPQTYDIEVKHLEKYASGRIKLSDAAVKRVKSRSLK